MRKIAVYIGITIVATLSVCQADVVTDGTLGNKVHLHGGQMTIDQGLGQVRRGNLFHSFKVFDINKGQTATFTNSGNHAINNVISRVTGHQPSSINGTLEVDKTTMPKANFYLINPNGVMFGEGSVVDVPGAFHVSTADYIKFMDKKVFSASHSNNSSLTTSEPASFGFLGNHQANLSIEGVKNLNLNLSGFNPKRATFTASNIFINNSTIKNSGGEVYLRAVGNAKTDVPINDDGHVNLRHTNYNGTLNMDKSTIRTDGLNGGGLIIVQAGNITINNQSNLNAQNEDVANANKRQGIRIGAADTVNILNSGKIRATSYGSGKSGQIIVSTGSMHIAGEGSGIFSQAGSDNADSGNGDAGDITVNAHDAITITDSGVITSSNFTSSGNGGAISISADNITIDSHNKNGKTGVLSDTCSNNWEGCRDSIGNAGNIKIKAPDIYIRNYTTVSSTSNNKSGNGGEITINFNKQGEKAVNLNNSITHLINSQITTTSKSGNGGNITIGGKSLILNGGFIQANTSGVDKKGGNIKIKVDTLLASHGKVNVGGKVRQSFQPGVNVIQAVSEKGASGTINSTAPELNINGAMLNLKSNYLHNPDLNANPCKTSKGSSLVQSGHGGLPQKPSDGVYIPSHVTTDTEYSPHRDSAVAAVAGSVSNCKPTNATH